MKVLFLSRTDYANVGYLFAQSLRSVGVSAIAVANKPRVNRIHAPYDVYYQENKGVLKKYIEKADTVVWMHSTHYPLIELIPSVKGKRLAVFHGGSAYRNDPAGRNALFNRRVYVSLIQTANMLGLGAKNEKWVIPPVDINNIKPNYASTSYTYPSDQRLFIGHYPSDPLTKNSEAINSVMDRLSKDPDLSDKFMYDYDDKLRPWRENIQRIRGCDIYIESLSTEIEGKVTNEWGVTALEAAASGCVTVSVFNSVDRYAKEFGSNAAILPIADEEDLERRLRQLLLATRSEIKRIQIATRKWVTTMHSFKAVGEKLREALEI